MAYTPLFSEILDKVAKLKTKKQKVDFLRQHNTDALRMILKSSFDPKIVWQLPEGEVPFSPNDAPESLDPYLDSASFSSRISISLIERFKVLVF